MLKPNYYERNGTPINLFIAKLLSEVFCLFFVLFLFSIWPTFSKS